MVSEEKICTMNSKINAGSVWAFGVDEDPGVGDAQNHIRNLGCITWKKPSGDQSWAVFAKIILMGGYGTGPAGFQDSVVTKLRYPCTLHICHIEFSN